MLPKSNPQTSDHFPWQLSYLLCSLESYFRFKFKSLSSFLTFNFSLAYYPHGHDFRNSMLLLTCKQPPVCVTLFSTGQHLKSRGESPCTSPRAVQHGAAGRQLPSGLVAHSLPWGSTRGSTFWSVLRVRRRSASGPHSEQGLF